MKTDTAARTLSALVLALAGLSTANAATLTVDRNNPASNDRRGRPFRSIGAALARVQPGDTVRVMAGSYLESNLLVRMPRVTLQGVGGPVLDGVCQDATGVIIEADGVEVSGFEIRQMRTAIAAPHGGSKLMIQNNRVVGAETGIWLTGATRSVIRNNDLTGGDCLLFAADVGILLEDGGRNMIGSNIARGFGDAGVSIDDDGDLIVENKAVGNRDGFEIDGDGNVLRDNTAVDGTDDGFEVDGNENRLNDSVSLDNADKGFDADGEANLFRGNTAAGNADDGFRSRGDFNKFFSNVSRMNGEDGWDIRGSFNRLESNLAMGNAEEGIQIPGSDNVACWNRSIDNIGDGFELKGATANRTMLCGNEAVENLKEGIELKGNDNTVVRNLVAENEDNGLRVDGAGNMLRGNRSEENEKFGIRDTTGPDAASVANTYVGNVCIDNEDGASNPEGLCD